MKLFSFDRYTKPGKGVEKNEKPKPAFIRFFIILWRKKSALAAVNSLYVLFSCIITLLAAAAFGGCVALYDAFSVSSNIGQAISENADVSDLYFRIMAVFAIFFTSIPVFSSGPLQAGFTYIIKSFYKEEPVFIWHDFISKAKSNFSLALKTGLVNLCAALFVMINTTAYMVISDPNNPVYSGALPSWMLFVIALVSIFFGTLLTMMNLYLYPMMVTFNVSFRQLFKNSFVLVMIKWLPSLGIIILDLLLVAAPVFLLPVVNYIAFVAVLILYIIITPGFIGLINMFFVYPIFKKYMIDNPNADKSEKTGTENETAEETPVKAGGHFENGMWVEE